jgi:eukaryotic-like serine/threonine-protein kinase
LPDTPPDLDVIFCAAIELLSADARAAYLADACTGDDALRRQVESLVAAHFRAGSFLDRPSPAPGLTANWGEPDAPGTLVGPYRLLEPIGEGGMGVVYVAEQTNPVKRRVAVKLIKPGMDTAVVLARFEAERQALALMDHPNIARILDGGATAAGRPYFVMELVRGLPITEYCDRTGLPPRDRLALFVAVCRAVQHAHRKGVIHRDLKPSNVLVTLHDGVPVPKVIDFGVAKAVGQPLTDRSEYTRFNQLVGTPLYMAPEQAELSGLDVDTRADVYSLGVLLYELLTGTTPFDPEALRAAALDEVRRIIREEEPPRPSMRVSTLGADKRSGVSGRRGLDERRLVRLLQGDLDWVAMRALEKDRNRRYDSPDAMAGDVERFLANQPVEARPPSVWDRLLKSARRNRAALVTGGLVGVALLSGTAVSIWQAVRATDALRRAEMAEQQAIAEADTVRTVNDFLRVDLIGQADTGAQFGLGYTANPRLTVWEALDRAAARIGDRFRDRPLAEAELRAAIGGAYRGIGAYRKALPHLERTVELRTAHLGPDHPKTLDSTRQLAQAYSALNRHSEAVALQQQILDRTQAVHGSDHPATLRAIDELAVVIRPSGGFAEAVRMLESTYAKRSSLLGPDHPDTLNGARLLVFAYYANGNWEQALKLHTALNQEVGGPDHPETKLADEMLAHLLEAVGRLPEATAIYERALKECETRLGPEHETTLHRRNSLARVYLAAGRLEEAEGMFDRIVEGRKRIAGGEPDRPTANSLSMYALALLARRRYVEAELVLREAIRVYEAAVPEYPLRFNAISQLGEALAGQNKDREAEPLLVAGYEGLKQREGKLNAFDRQRFLPPAIRRLVAFYGKTGRPDEADKWRRLLPPEPPPAR